MVAIFHIGAMSTHSHKVLRDHTVFLCGNPAISIKWMDLEDLMPLISKISQKLFVFSPHPCPSRRILRFNILYPIGKGEAVILIQVIRGPICALRMVVWF